MAPKRNQWKPPIDTAIQQKPIHANRDSLTFGAGADPSEDSPVVEGAVSFNPAHPMPMVPAAGQPKQAEAKHVATAALRTACQTCQHCLCQHPSTRCKSQHSKPATTAATQKSQVEAPLSFSLDDETLVETSVEAAKPTSQKSTSTASVKSADEKPSFAPMLSHGANESVLQWS